MRIESVKIENFRSIKDETILFDNYTCFVGSNGSGKSTIINALNVFFRQYKDSKTDLSKLSVEDFHHKDVSKEIKITVTFSNLSAEAEKDFAGYFRQGKLIVTSVAKYDSGTERAEVKQFGSRLGIDDFKKFFEADKNKAKVADLKEIYKKFKEIYTDLRNATTKDDMMVAIHEYEESHSNKCILIPSEDQFYGVSKGVNRLEKYIQWVFIPASKDVIEESEESKTTALGQLLARTVRSKINFTEKVSKLRDRAKSDYQTLLDSEQAALNDISTSIEKRLALWSHPDVHAKVLWKQDPEKTVKIEEPWAFIKIGERGFEGELARFGHGLQRSYMLALLQELSQFDDENAPTLIMGIEEPEIYQHPPQARYLAETLLELSEKNSQVLICSHCPLFIPGDNFDKVRIVREKGSPSYTTVKMVKYKEVADKLKESGEKVIKETGMVAKLYPSLNSITNEMFFCKVLVLVEGIEDVAYISSYLFLTGRILEFRQYGCHIVPFGGKSNLIKPLTIANLLEIPSYLIYDADTNKDSIPDPVKRKSETDKHKKDNRILLNILGYNTEDEWPKSDIVKKDLTMWNTNLTDIIKNEFGMDWEKYKDLSMKYYDQAGDLEKNPLAIAKTLEYAWNDKKESKILIELIERILIFAKAK